jgi:predicted permease
MIDGLPLPENQSATNMEPEDRPFAEDELAPIVQRRSVTPGYFAAMGTELVAGRDLTWDDAGDGLRSVVISEALARSFWPGQNAVGQRIRRQGSDNEGWEVVGVAENVRFDDVEAEPTELVYMPTVVGSSGETDAPRAWDIVVRAGVAPLGSIGAVREALRAVDPRLPLVNPRTVESVVTESMASTSFTVILLGIAAAVALLLGTVGIYGVISYIVSQRTQEIGVRMALGAPARSVLTTVVAQGLRLTALGVAIGLVASLGVGRVIASLLYEVSPTDPLTLGGTAILLTAVATLATWLPARRASRVAPVEALRAE